MGFLACEQATQWGKRAKINQRAERAERRLGKRTVASVVLALCFLRSFPDQRACSQVTGFSDMKVATSSSPRNRGPYDKVIRKAGY